VVRGGGTKLGAAVRPARCDLVLETTRLTGVIDHRQADFVATIAAGTSVAAADSVLGRHGQWIGVDPPFRDKATIGGVFATNDGGPRRVRSGAPRDRVLAVRFARADGKLIRAGAPVIKNVAGYDLPRLLTGTAGIFGVLVEVSVRVSPVPPASLTLAVSLGHDGMLPDLLGRLTRTSLEPSSLELTYPPPGLLVRFETVPEACRFQAERVAELAHQCGASVELLTPQTEERVWAEHIQRPWQGSTTVAAAAAPPTELARLLPWLASSDVPSGVRVGATGPLAWGELLLAIDGEPEAVAATVRGIRGRLEPAGGSLVLRRIPTALDGIVDPWGDRLYADRVLRALKAQLDPSGILNPGLLAGSTP